MARGLDDVYPFSDTTGVDGVLRDADTMLSPEMGIIGPKSAGRVWGFTTKFIMLDRFAKTLFGTDFLPGSHVPRRLCTEDYLGTSTKVSISLFAFHYIF